MKILVFGNPMVEKDSLAIKMIPKLKKQFSKSDFDFVEFDSSEDLHKQGRNLIILDVAQGIEKIEIIEDLDHLSVGRVYSMHDFDLAYNLKLLKKIGLLDSIKIIAIPQDMAEDEAFEGVKKMLENN
jgi:Ni,Fe-hydrogenase maturation factor